MVAAIVVAQAASPSRATNYARLQHNIAYNIFVDIVELELEPMFDNPLKENKGVVQDRLS